MSLVTRKNSRTPCKSGQKMHTTIFGFYWRSCRRLMQRWKQTPCPPTGWHGVTGFANYFHGEGLLGVIGLPAGITCCLFFLWAIVGASWWRAGNAPDAWRLGFTSFVHKADALLYTLSLEATVSDRQADLKAYGERVISCLSDQGLSTFELILWKLHCFYLCVTSY